MKQTVIIPHLRSNDPALIERQADLNVPSWMDFIAGGGRGRPLARYVNNGDLPEPPAPAWYLPESHEVYIHLDAAHVKGVPMIDVPAAPHTITSGGSDTRRATILGLLAHELGHAAISGPMDDVIRLAPHHRSLITMLEELRVENHAVRTAAQSRRFMRASFALILANLPDEFASKSHVARAWAMCRGRTLAGIADRDETHGVDLAARTLLGDDVVDGLTDLLQESLTLRMDRFGARKRMVDICDEWVELVGDPPEEPGCTTCTRWAKPGEKPDSTGKGSPAAGTPDGDDTGEGDAGGDGDADADDDADGKGDGDADDGDPDDGDSEGDGLDGGDPTSERWTGEAAYGTAGQDDPADDSDNAHVGDPTLDDEAAELMKMMARDLADKMQDEWMKDPEGGVQLAPSGEWAAKVFGNRKPDARLTRSEPTAKMRQEVVQVAAELSRLSLPAIAKTAKSMVVPPGRLRSREAVRAAAERAQGRMVTATPWKGTVRRHTSARPLVLGIATDTSGSMRWAESGVAEYAYVYANAGHRIGARTAAVTFGDHVHRIARPGEVLDHVVRKTASDGTEEFDQAMAALDGVLHLTVPSSTARILLVVSDGALVKGGETARAVEWLTRMDRAGTHVLWITDREADRSFWLGKIAKRLPHVTTTAVGETYERRRGSVFDALNRVTLEAVRTDISR